MKIESPDGRVFYVDSDSGHITSYDHAGAQRPSTASLSDRERSALLAACIHGHGAMMYVWGRQDAGESEHDTGAAQRFGEWYGLSVFRFRMGEHHTYDNAERAYQEWRKVAA